MLAVEKQRREHLVRARAQVQLHVVLDRLRGIQGRALLQLLGPRAAREFKHGHQLGPLGAAAQTLEALQVIGAGVQQASHALELCQQLLRHLQHAAPGGAGAQQQRQQFGIAQGAGAAREQFLARAGVGRKVFQGHRVRRRRGFLQSRAVYLGHA